MSGVASSSSRSSGSPYDDMQEGEISETSPTPEGYLGLPEPLPKGRACLQCRSRKRRCDGVRPTCGSCSREKRECTYKDKPKSYSRARTRDLLVAVSTLEEQYAKLEMQKASKKAAKAMGSSRISPSTPSTVSTTAVSPSLPTSPLGDGPTQSLGGKTSAAEDSDAEWWTRDPPPREIQKQLLQLFLTHRRRAAFHFPLCRFWESLAPSYQGDPPLPALLNAMYLMACYWSGDPKYTNIEATFVQRTRSLLANSLGDASASKMQWLQASGLLAYYLACRSRLLEARQELAGTIPLLLQCGFQRIKSSLWQPPDDTQPYTDLQSTELFLPPPRDTIEVGERICTFWMIFHYDLIVSLVSGLPPSKDITEEMCTVWPRDFEEYEQGQEELLTPDGWPSDLFGDQPAKPFDPPCSLYALRCKAAVIMARVASFSTRCSPEFIRTPEYSLRFNEYHAALDFFIDHLPPLTYSPPQSGTPVDSKEDVKSQPINILVYSTHTAALFTLIQLYDSSKPELQVFRRLYDRRLQVAMRAATLIRAFMVSGTLVELLPVTCVSCWFPVARVVAEETRRLQTINAPPQDLGHMQEVLTQLLHAMTAVKDVFSIFELALNRLHAYIDGKSNDELATTAAIPP